MRILFLILFATVSLSAQTPTPSVCIEDGMSLRSEPAKSSKFITTVGLGEEVTWLGRIEKDAKTSQDYYDIKLSDGTTGWILTRGIVTKAKAGVMRTHTSVFTRPNLLNSTDKSLEPLAFVAILQKQSDGWMEVVEGKLDAPSGDRLWVKDAEVSIDKNDLALAVIAAKVMREKDEEKKKTLIASVMNNSALTGTLLYSVFLTAMGGINRESSNAISSDEAAHVQSIVGAKILNAARRINGQDTSYAVVFDSGSVNRLMVCSARKLNQSLKNHFSKNVFISDLCWIQTAQGCLVHFQANDNDWDVHYYWDQAENKLYFVTRKWQNCWELDKESRVSSVSDTVMAGFIRRDAEQRTELFHATIKSKLSRLFPGKTDVVYKVTCANQKLIVGLTYGGDLHLAQFHDGDLRLFEKYFYFPGFIDRSFEFRDMLPPDGDELLISGTSGGRAGSVSGVDVYIRPFEIGRWVGNYSAGATPEDKPDVMVMNKLTYYNNGIDVIWEGRGIQKYRWHDKDSTLVSQE